MKYLFILLSLCFIGCKGSKVVSEQSNTVKTIEVKTQDLTVKFDKLRAIDTTDLNQLNTGRVITKEDKKTGIKTNYKIVDENLISEIEVPEKIRTITVSDTTTTIKETTTIVREQRRNFWDQVKEKFNFTILIFIVLSCLILICRKI